MDRNLEDTTRRLRLVAIGDVGNDQAYHVGDEAMLVGLREEIKASGVSAEWTVISAKPQVSERLLGVPAVPRFGFGECADERDRMALLARLDAVLALPGRRWLPAAPAQWRATLRAIRSSDGVVISGGGNLCSAWPEHVFERLAVARTASRAGRPLAITGQTFGPDLSGGTREPVAEILRLCAFVGAREEASYRLALDLGVSAGRLFLQHDDAIGLAPWEPAGVAGGRGEFIAVTVNPLGETAEGRARTEALGRQLGELARETGAGILLVPHVGNLDAPFAHDEAMALSLLAVAGNPSVLRVAPLPSPHQAVWYCREAAMVVSTRYHPVVFATGTSTPPLFVHQDEYTRTKGEGALSFAGLDGWSLSIDAAASGLLLPAALDLWRARDAVRAHLARMRPRIEQGRRRHVGRLLAALRGTPIEPVGASEFREPPGPRPGGEWRATLGALAEFTARVAALEERARTGEGYAASLVEEVRRKDAEMTRAGEALAEWHHRHAGAVAGRDFERERRRRAEDWARALAEELRLKDAELLTVHTALARRLGPGRGRPPSE